MKNESLLLNGEVRLDDSRKERCGFPEFIFGANKTEAQLLDISNCLFNKNKVILITRVDEKTYKKIASKLPPELTFDKNAKAIYYFSKSRLEKLNSQKPKIGILTAGSSDMGVAIEAKLTAEACGFKSELIMDVGVAGIHRLFNQIDKIRKYKVIIVIAGMEGALPSVVGGLVSCPVIAVPTSVGYGASFNGITALLAMLNSCANGITVVNIDNGFGAGCAAVRCLGSSSKNGVVEGTRTPDLLGHNQAL